VIAAGVAGCRAACKGRATPLGKGSYQKKECGHEKKDIADAQKEVMAEAKGRGYDTKVLRKVVALRKRDANDLAEEEAVLDMYKSALGM